MADKQASTQYMHLNNTSSSAQRARLLAYLRQHGSINTFDAIRLLNILRPGARISELRAQGIEIRTQLSALSDDHGRPHSNVATYYLCATPTTRQPPRQHQSTLPLILDNIEG